MPSLAGQDEGSVPSAISHIDFCRGLEQGASLIVPAQHKDRTCIFTDGLLLWEPLRQALSA